MTSDFVRRAGFTLGALLVYRLGCNIPLPGLNSELIQQPLQTEIADGVKASVLSGGEARASCDLRAGCHALYFGGGPVAVWRYRFQSSEAPAVRR
jgi:hypothetical protein